MSDPQLSPETIAISAGRPPVTKDGSLNPDISLSSTYHAGGELGYGRSGNETWSALESAISELEGGTHHRIHQVQTKTGTQLCYS